MKKILSYIFIVVILLAPQDNLAQKQDKSLIISLDNMDFKYIEKLGLEDYGLGLMNIKVRNSNKEEDLLTSINVGRKIRREQLSKEKIDLDFLGNIFRGRIAYFGDGNSKLKYLAMNQAGIYKNIEASPDLSNVLQAFKDNQVLVVEFNMAKDESIDQIRQLTSQVATSEIYLITSSMDPRSSQAINRSLVPIMISGERAVLTSPSTRREGLVSLEDINLRLKESAGLARSKTDIGKPIDFIGNNDPYNFIAELYNRTNNLALISYIFHGISYLSLAFLFLALYLKKFEKYSLILFLININNIFLSFLLGLTIYTNNILFYILVLGFMNIFFTKALIKNIEGYRLLALMTYLIILIGGFFKIDIIYNSFIGFNNLMYGVRYYGFNNAMVGLVLGLSIIVMDLFNRSSLSRINKNIAILVINLLNILVLSTRYGANTGGFLTALVLLGLSIYSFIMEEKISIKFLISIISLGLVLLGLNFYLDSLDGSKSHGLEFLIRIRQKGLGEFYYIAIFKLKELIRFTLMPPFSLVIASEVLLAKKLYRNGDRTFKLILLTSLVGFFINDTGNLIIIYMLNYGILVLLSQRIKEKDLSLN